MKALSVTKLSRIDPVSLAQNPRATFAAWQRYEPMILAAYRMHPRPYTYAPSNMSSASVCSKARDAIRGKLAFDYPSEVSAADLSDWYSEVVFKNDATHVYIGTPERLKGTLQGNEPQSTTLSFPTLSFEEVSAFMLLLSGARLKGPVIIQSPPDITLLPSRPNVEILNRTDGSLVLL